MKITIKHFGLKEVSNDILSELKILFDKAYYDSKMYENFLEDLKEEHEYFKVFLAYNNKKIVGIVVLEDKMHKSIAYGNYKPVHIKRFTVDSNYRSLGIGKKLLDESKKFAFNNYNLSVIYGESNEIGGISFYLREGGLFSLDIVKNYLRRNSQDENLYFFKEFVTNKKLKNFRYPIGGGLLFVYPKNDLIKKEFFLRGFLGKKELFNINKI